MPSLLMQVLSLVGAALVLVGFGGQQFAGLRSDDLAYGLLNLVGSGLLASSAVVPLNAGVLLLKRPGCFSASTWSFGRCGVHAVALIDYIANQKEQSSEQKAEDTRHKILVSSRPRSGFSNLSSAFCSLLSGTYNPPG